MSAFIRKGDFWSGLTLVALGAYIVKEAWSWEYLTVDGPGPGAGLGRDVVVCAHRGRRDARQQCDGDEAIRAGARHGSLRRWGFV